MNDYMNTYNEWLKSPFVSESAKEELLSLDDAQIKERFYKDLDFGTAGLRGVIEQGSNRMNIYTVRKATQGICEDLLNEDKENAQKGVVIAYDSRRMSYEFALESAKVLAANGIKAYLFESLRPVPVLSFAVRYLGCARGIMITASHNPKEYNGYKAYGADGGQLPPESAGYVLSIIRSIDTFKGVKVMDAEEAKKAGLIVMVGSEVDNEYYKNVVNQSVNSEAVLHLGDDFKVIYSPFHGTGNIPVRTVLDKIGCKNVRVVPEQELPDTEFSTVKSPNPEEKEGFTLAIEMAKKDPADIIFATDPDSDRLGVIIKDSAGEYKTLNGNQIGILLSEFILRNKSANGTLSKKGAVIKTIVTTEMLKPVAQKYGVKVYDVLTGFKYIAEKIKEFEEGILDNEYVFGFEESYGSLAGTYCRDKDAVLAAMLVTEMAAEYKLKGMTLYDGLINLYEEYGYYLEKVKTLTFEGMDGADKMRKIMDTFRENPPKTIAGIKVTQLLDVQKGTLLDIESGAEEKCDYPKENVLRFTLGDEGWIAVRPSGTEPKIKFYFGIKSSAMEQSEKKIEECIKEMENLM